MVQDIVSEIGESTFNKIKKLLARSRGTDNENESASAMNLAMGILAKHELSLSDIDGIETEENIDCEYLEVGTSRRRCSWKTNLLQTLAEANFCYMYTMGTKGCLVGKYTNRKTVEIMYNYLINVINNEALLAFAKYTGWEHGKTFCNSFRLGMVDRILVRLRQKQQEICNDITSNTSLVIANPYKKATDEALAFISSKGVRLHNVPAVKSGISGAGYQAGRSKADTIVLSSNNALQSRN